MKHKQRHLLLLLPVVAALGLFIGTITQVTHSVQALSSPCPGTNTVMIDTTAPTQPTVLSTGPHQLLLSASGLPAPISSVYFTFDDTTASSHSNYIGRGISQNGGSYWSMTWLTDVSPGGTHYVGATVNTPNGPCSVQPTTVTLGNTSQTTLSTVASPTQFNDYTNVSRDFSLKTMAAGSSLDLTQWAVYPKGSVSVGVINAPDDSSLIHYFSGSVAGQGTIQVGTNYGGVMLPMSIPVSVYAQTSGGSPTPTTSPTTTTTTVSSSSSGSTSSPTTTTSPPPATTTTTATSEPATSQPGVDSDPVIKDCIITAITMARYELINEGKDRPTAAEVEATRQCFETRNFIIPGTFAPVVPSKTAVKAQPITTTTTVSAVTTSTVKLKNTTKEALTFSGHTKPNTAVLIYVFSEPLVLSTSSNSDGEWSYALQDPMAPGKHEAYAIVNKGDGSYQRSSVFDFAIAKAAAAPSNPNGYSFKVESNVSTPIDSSYSTKLYLFGVGGLLVVVMAVLGFWTIRRQKHVAAPILLHESSLITPTNSPAVSDEQDPPAPTLGSSV